MTSNWGPDETVSYRILYFEGNDVTMFLEGETRETELGDKVVWVLRLRDETAFCWRRTDWPDYACTAELTHCHIGS